MTFSDHASSLVKCSICGVLLASRNQTNHFFKLHSPEAERLRQRERHAIAAMKAEELRLVSVLKCPECSNTFLLREMKAHYLNAHLRPLPSDLKAAIGETNTGNKFRSSAQRDEYWKSTEGPTKDDDQSQDVFAKGQVVSGGAFGLGRNRKN